MKLNRSVYSFAAAAALGLAALGVSGAAQAGDVYWSVGVSSPGVRVGMASAPPMVMQPVFLPQQPVYMPMPQPVVYVRPAPVYVAQAAWGHPGRGWHRGHAYGHYQQARFERERHEHGHGRGQRD